MYLYIVSASTSANQTLRSGVKPSPWISSICKSSPPIETTSLTLGIGVIGESTGPIPSQNVYSARSIIMETNTVSSHEIKLN